MNTYAKQKAITKAIPQAEITPLRSAIPNSAVLSKLNGLSSSRINLPETMNARLTERFGVSMPRLKIYRDSGLSDFGEIGYAHGNEIHLDEELDKSTRDTVVMHEAAHVIQTGSGLARGTGIMTNTALECSADRGFSAPQNFVMPSGGEGPVQGFLGWGKQKDEDESRQIRSIINESSDADFRKKLEFDPAKEEGNIFRKIAARTILRPLSFIGKKITGLKRKIFGYREDDAAKTLAENNKGVTGDIGDAGQFNIPQGTEGDWTSGLKSTVLPATNFLTGTAAGTGSMLTNSGLGALGVDGFGSVATLAKGGAEAANVLSGAGAWVGGIEGAGSSLGRLGSAVNSSMMADTSRKGGNTSGAISAGMQAATDLTGAAYSGAKMAAYMGAPTGVAGNLVPGLGIALGGAQAIKGGIDFINGAKQQHAMTNAISSVTDGTTGADFSNEQRLKLVRSMQMARETAAINKEAGAWDAAAGTLGAVGSGVTLSGVGSAAGAALSGTGAVVGALGKMNKSESVDEMHDKVAEHEIGLHDRVERLKEELIQSGEKPDKYDRETLERIVLKRMGYNSGTKKEVFLNIAMNRAKYMSDTANDTRHKAFKRQGIDKSVRGEARYDFGEGAEGEERRNAYRQRRFVRKTLKSMGLSKVNNATDSQGNTIKGYAMQGIGEKLGMDAGVNVYDQLNSSRSKSEKQEIEDEIAARQENLAGLNSGGFRFAGPLRRWWNQSKLDDLTQRRTELYGANPAAPQANIAPQPVVPIPVPQAPADPDAESSVIRQPRKRANTV